MSHWRHHPGVRTGDKLTRGERAADLMRNGMGSWPFVFSFIIAMLFWAAINTIVIEKVIHGKPFDPYPYILLNLLLSTLAGLQGAILLIAAKRADQVAAEQAVHHLRISESNETLTKQLAESLKTNNDLTTEIHALTIAIHGHILNEQGTEI